MLIRGLLGSQTQSLFLIIASPGRTSLWCIQPLAYEDKVNFVFVEMLDNLLSIHHIARQTQWNEFLFPVYGFAALHDEKVSIITWSLKANNFYFVFSFPLNFMHLYSSATLSTMSLDPLPECPVGLGNSESDIVHPKHLFKTPWLVMSASFWLLFLATAVVQNLLTF